MTLDELIEKNEAQSKMLKMLIDHPDTAVYELHKLMACRRFIVGFITDLKQLKIPSSNDQGEINDKKLS